MVEARVIDQQVVLAEGQVFKSELTVITGGSFPMRA